MSVRDFVDFLVRQIVDEDSYEIVMLEDNDNVEIKVFDELFVRGGGEANVG